MLAEMVSLETENPDVYQQFTQGNLTAQLSEHSTSGRMEPDKVIEMTINKTPGGTTGFTMKADSMMRRTLNASYRAELRKCLYTHLNYSPQLYSHKGLTTIRILKDEKRHQIDYGCCLNFVCPSLFIQRPDLHFKRTGGSKRC